MGVAVHIVSQKRQPMMPRCGMQYRTAWNHIRNIKQFAQSDLLNYPGMDLWTIKEMGSQRRGIKSTQERKAEYQQYTNKVHESE